MTAPTPPPPTFFLGDVRAALNCVLRAMPDSGPEDVLQHLHIAFQSTTKSRAGAIHLTATNQFILSQYRLDDETAVDGTFRRRQEMHLPRREAFRLLDILDTAPRGSASEQDCRVSLDARPATKTLPPRLIVKTLTEPADDWFEETFAASADTTHFPNYEHYSYLFPEATIPLMDPLVVSPHLLRKIAEMAATAGTRTPDPYASPLVLTGGGARDRGIVASAPNNPAWRALLMPMVLASPPA